MNTRSFIIALLLALTAGIAGYYVGEKEGIKKGAFAGSGIAFMNAESQHGFMIILEKNLNEGIPGEETLRELMIGALESYQPVRALLAAEPYGHEYSSSQFEFDQKQIEEAIGRLKASEAVLAYREQIQSEVSTPFARPSLTP